jgi:succinate dehydrogenase/fumarate reductase-like Fe-S protein
MCKISHLNFNFNNIFYIELPRIFQPLFVIRDVITSKAPTILHTKHSEDWIEDGSVYEPKHVTRNTTNTSNKLRAVYGCINLQVYTTYINI